ncbi:MAG TPA: DedA family protein [Steroidobacteraceae bacterium]|jgi:membrane-associated protein|nr:DedA family protein [Steroidobacteraceae bacterium]
MELVHWFMEWVYWFFDLVLHLDAHLIELLRDYGFWVYLILFAIVFAETGFVVTPFLPGDALLFAAGALAAVDTSGTLSAPLVSLTLAMAAITGNTTNYHVGRWIGPQAFSGKYRLLKMSYLRRTEEFFARHGSLTIVLARFVPVVRTCVPFVAGIARMPYGRFQAYNVAGALVWVLSLVWAGFFFGNIPIIKNNFGIVTIGIVVLSVLPMAWVALKEALKK